MPRLMIAFVTAALALAVVILGANLIVLRGGTGAAERVADVPPTDAALVLGAGIWPDGTPTPALRERLLAAAELVQAGRVRQVVASGGADEVPAMRRELIALGVPADRIVADAAGTSTRASMRNAVGQLELHDVTVVTQRFHMARALWLARRNGLDAHGLVADGRIPWAPRHGGAREVLARTKAVSLAALGV